jgi:hypothetical protein
MQEKLVYCCTYDKKIHEARAFNFTYRYIDDVLFINNSRFGEFLPLIYPPELEVKETTDKRGTIRTHWYADDLLKQYPSKGDKYVIDEELQHTDHLFLGVASSFSCIWCLYLAVDSLCKGQ